MSTWSAAKENWTTGDLVLATDLNLIGNDINWLKAPPSANVLLNHTNDLFTTSTSFVDVNNTLLTLSITTTGGNLLIGFSGTISNSTLAAATYLDVNIFDGSSNVRFAGDDGLTAIQQSVASHMYNASFVVLKTGLPADTYTLTLQWKVTSGTALLYSGAGTSQHDIHGHFWVREV